VLCDDPPALRGAFVDPLLEEGQEEVGLALEL